MFSSRGSHGNMEWLSSISPTSTVHRHLKENLTRTMGVRVLGSSHSTPKTTSNLVRKVIQHCFEASPFDNGQKHQPDSKPSPPPVNILSHGTHLLYKDVLNKFNISCDKLEMGMVDDDEGEEQDVLADGLNPPSLTDLSHLERVEDSINLDVY